MLTMYAIGNVDDGPEEEDLVANEALAKYAVIAKINEEKMLDTELKFNVATAVWHPRATHSGAWIGCQFVEGDDYWYYHEVKVFETEDEITEAFGL